MISLCICISLLVEYLLLTSWGTARAARAVGSLRGRFWIGLRAVVFVNMAAIFFLIADRLLQPINGAIPALLVRLLVVVGVWYAAFFALQHIFNLSFRRTFAPLAAYILFSFAQIALAMGVVKPFLMEAFVIPAAGMAPTLQPGNMFAAVKIISPHRWDIVAYRNNGAHPSTYCKRVVGLPGERLRFEGGNIFVNDRAVPMPTVLAGRCHASVTGVPPRYTDGQTITLGSDEYFFIGDNVAVSADSRVYGPSKRSSLVGVVDLIYWPLNDLRILR